MTKSKICQSKENSESYNSAVKALEDMMGTSSESIPNINEPLQEYASPNTVKIQNSINMDNVTELMNKLYPKEDERANSNELKRNTVSNHSSCSEVSSVKVDSKVISETFKQLDSAKGNSDNESNSSDFSPDSISQSKEEITAWEKWFVMKQEQIRRRAEKEKKKKMQKTLEIKHKEELKLKKIEESEVNRKLWLKQKKTEEKEKRDIEKKEKELLEKERRLKQNPKYTFENWSLKKYQEKRFDLLEKDYIKKQDEEEKKKKLRQNEEAVKRWMSKAKNRPTTPQITYAYCGGSAIGFYDSTRPPPPAYVNPIPWQDPF